MATTHEELLTVWNTIIRENYGDPSTLDNAINLTSWAAVTSTDLLAHLLASVLVNTRTPNSYGWSQTLTSAQKKQLYAELDSTLTALKAQLDAVQGAVHTAYTALP